MLIMHYLPEDVVGVLLDPQGLLSVESSSVRLELWYFVEADYLLGSGLSFQGPVISCDYALALESLLQLLVLAFE